MPNQLHRSKRRQSLAEHEAVLAALAAIARRERTSVMALLRAAARETVRRRAADPVQAAVLRPLLARLAPKTPARFASAAQLSRFKRTQREFDRVLLDLNLASPAAVQGRNSPVAADQPVRLVNFDDAHAAV
jgi:hypothetical protein